MVEQDLQLDCRLLVRVPLANYERCVQALLDTRQIELEEVGARLDADDD